MDPAALDALVLAALAPRGLAERVRNRLVGGLTARQVFERMDGGARLAVLDAALAPVAAELRAVEAVASALRRLAASGQVRRSIVAQAQEMRVKGVRAIEIDVYRPK